MKLRTSQKLFLYAALASLLAVLFFLMPQSLAEQTRPQFYHLSIEQGLSQSTVQTMLQDSKGFMWIGTQDGLNRYDGYTFTVYRHEAEKADSLSSQYISALYEDQEGTLWVGTLQGGLNKMNRDTGTFVHYMHSWENGGSLSSDAILALNEDTQGNIWVGTSKGLNILNKKTGLFTRYRHQPSVPGSLSHDRVTAIVRDDKGNMWVGTDNGLNRFHSDTQRFTSFFAQENEPYEIYTMIKDNQGRLLVGTSKGIDVWELENVRTTSLSYWKQTSEEGFITSLWQDGAGGLWVGTYDGLAYVSLDKDEVNFHRINVSDPRSLNTNKIQSLYGDRAGRMWVGTFTGGINILDRYRHKFQAVRHSDHEKNSLINNMVRGFQEDAEGNLWIATEGGLDRLDKNGSYTHYVHDNANPFTISANVVFGVYLDRQGRIWAHTLEGISYFDKEKNQFIRYQIPKDAKVPIGEVDLRCIYEDRKGNLWLGSEKGLLYIEAKGKSYRLYTSSAEGNGLSDNRVRWIYEDREGDLWIGSPYGTSRFNPNTGTFVNYFYDPMKPGSIGSNMVYCIWEDEDALWLGTHGGGLNRYSKTTGKFSAFTTKDGLPNDVVYGILHDDKGNLWLSTNRGLSMFDRRQGLFRNYGVSDGLQSSEFNAGAFYRSQRGELFFGGVNGFNRFFPDAILYNPTPPPLAITGLQLDRQEVPLSSIANGIISMKYNQKHIRIEFAALDYTSPEKNLYSYRLEGYDQDWIYAGSTRYVSYTNLEPGEYVFRVRGANSDGVWNQEGISIRLVVEPPLWKTWWAYGLYLAALMGSVFAYTRYRLRAEERKLRKIAEYNRILEENVQARTLELQKANEKLKYLSQHDSLTGLYNRRGFHGAQERFSNPEYAPVSIIVCDLNGLKLVNDMLGHQYGDALIAAAGKVVESAFRTNDMVARIGGDEFAVLLPSCGEGTLARACARLREAIDKYNQENGQFYLSMSIGTAVSSNESVNMKDLFIAADDAMYQEKFVCKLEVQGKILEHIRKIKEEKLSKE